MKAMRGLILWLLRWSGVMRLWCFRRRSEIIVLTVHGVMDPDAPSAWVPLRPRLSPQRLEKCIRSLSKRYHFVSLEDVVDMLSGRKPLQPYSVALTFDDGYRGHVKQALPILRRYGVPATFFVATGHVEQRKPFWFDRLDYALQHASVDGREVQIGQRRIRIRATDRSALRASYAELREAAKATERDDLEMLRELEDLAETLEAESGRRLSDIFEVDDWSAVLTWEEIQGVQGSDVSFGSHTVDHIRLGRVDDHVISDQLRCSKHIIEARTGRPCHCLAYPDGSFSPKAAAIARASGYQAAVTTVAGTSRVGDDPLALRRLDLPLSGSSTDMLARAWGVASLFGLTEKLPPWPSAITGRYGR